MENFEKYEKSYFLPPQMTYDWVRRESIEKPPIWCSVDLRDGNQALIDPMSLDEKLEYFRLLVELGFKEIEVGYPSESESEYQFLRTLIEKQMIPEDVTIQVLTDADADAIRRTFDAIEGAKRVIVHLYHATSLAWREQVLNTTKKEIKENAVKSARQLLMLAKHCDSRISFQYSPESFHQTEVEFALELCNAVLEVFRPTRDHKAIINIPTTVENVMPHVFACQIEYIHKHIKYRDAILLCLHPHNDRGCGVATAELGILAGADRIEGTLFGNGERTGNVDIVTLGMNLCAHGIDCGLDFRNIKRIREIYERLTRMEVPARQPYAGDLVFTAFSQSHQDAITKGMEYRRQHPDIKWTVPYLSVDPKDIGRAYDSDVMRANRQSGKGRINYILKHSYGINVPQKMREDVGYLVKDLSDRLHQELSPEWVYRVFEDQYINARAIFTIDECHFKQIDGITAEATIRHKNENHIVTANGSGRLDAVSNAIKRYFNISYEMNVYEEHLLTRGSSSKTVAYVGILCKNKMYWGVGIDADLIKASIAALIVAVNRIDEIASANAIKDERMLEILNFIQANYTDITLDSLSDRFSLTKPYLSKYIKEKSGVTFGEVVKNIRLNKAKALLKNSNMTVETISLTIGYPNVEHFNRLFKKEFQMTPMQYRNKK